MRRLLFYFQFFRVTYSQNDVDKFSGNVMHKKY